MHTRLCSMFSYSSWAIPTKRFFISATRAAAFGQTKSFEHLMWPERYALVGWSDYSIVFGLGSGLSCPTSTGRVGANISSRLQNDIETLLSEKEKKP